MPDNKPLSDKTKRFSRAWIKAEITELWADPVKYVVSEDVTLSEAIAQLKEICEDLDVSFDEMVDSQPQPNKYAMGLILGKRQPKTSVK